MKVDLAEIEKLGAASHAKALTELDNPFLALENLPAKTGESLEDWKKKHDAWQRGFIIQSMHHGDDT